MQAEYFALEGVTDLLFTIERIQDTFNPDLLVQGVVLTMFDERTNLAQQVTENLRSYFGPRLYTTVIPRNVRLAEAPSHGLPVLFYDPRSRGAEAYRALARELLDRLQIAPPVAEPDALPSTNPTAPTAPSGHTAGNPPPEKPRKARFWGHTKQD